MRKDEDDDWMALSRRQKVSCIEDFEAKNTLFAREKREREKREKREREKKRERAEFSKKKRQKR